MQERLGNRVIVIVGGTSGLGVSAAAACVAEGASVVLVGRDAKKCEAAAARLGDRARALSGDAADPRTAERAIELGAETFGGFHGLYHVAGGSGRSQGDGPLDQLSDRGWSYTLRLNLDSMFYSNRAAARWLLEAKQMGSILNMTSVLASSPAPKYFATHAYAAAKAAAIGLTTTAASYYARHSIRFNAIAPALVETPMSGRAAEDPEIRRYIASKQPLDGGRIGRVEDVDQAVVYLLSDDARFVTGQVLAIDGGWMVSEGQYDDDANA